MSPTESPRLACIELHDVAPATWPECAAILRMLDDAGASALTLLVVPQFHRGAHVKDDAGFRRALDSRVTRGDELVLHGYYHLDEEPPPRTVHGFVTRRVLTRAEGEFAALGEAEAAERLARGVELFATHGWPLHGFVPPAWLMSRPARAAVAGCAHRFEYVALRGGVYRLPQWRYAESATLCYSPDRAWRRAMSRSVIRGELARAKSLPCLRLAIHPQDARVPEVMRHWRELVEGALGERAAATQRDAARLM
jgi:predicted deacetylase